MKKTRRDNLPTREPLSPLTTEQSETALNSASMQTLWDDYWFTPQTADSLVQVQRVVCAVAAIWFLCQFNASSFWWGSQSWGAAEFSGRLEGFTEGEFPAQFRWSPLWLTHAFPAIFVWCTLGVGLAFMSALNFGGRVLRGVLALSILLLAQRQSWSNGTLEPYLIALAAYLAFARLSGDDWSHRFAQRLIQTHTWLLLCASLANQLAFSTWWQGDAVWWLAATDRSSLLVTDWLGGREMLINLITHGITLSTIVSVACLWPWTAQSSSRRKNCGMVAGWLVAIAYALIADQILFGCLLAGAVTVWRNTRVWPRVTQGRFV